MSVILQGIRWETYENLLCDLQDRRNPRLAFDKGVLEVMSPLPRHERRSNILEEMVTLLAEERAINIENFGSMTLKNPAQERGVEPDGCFYIQSVSCLPENLGDPDPQTLPPPDLIIEVDHTHPSLDKFPIYAGLGVSEIWHDDGIRVTIYRREETHMVESEDSVAFPGVRGEDITRFLTSSETMRRLDWTDTFRQWVRGGSEE
ncbi:MAG: Uma2 family endonuclease [Armatimonadaceae bacterium]